MADRWVDLLRHGEVEGGERLRGSRDDALTPRGWAQMRAALADPLPYDRILSSPARRCAEPARELAARTGLPLMLEPDLRERHFGDWEGQRADSIDPELLGRFWADPIGVTPPGAEPFDDFRARVLGGWERLRQTDARHSLVVTHGGVIRLMLGAVLGLADEALLLVEVPHAALSRLRLPAPPWRPSLVFHGIQGGPHPC